MSICRSVFLYCDAEAKDCPRKGDQFGDYVHQTAAAVRQAARIYGWVRRDGKDYCDDCAKRLGYAKDKP